MLFSDIIVLFVWNKTTRSSRTTGIQLQAMNVYLRLKLYLKTLKKSFG